MTSLNVDLIKCGWPNVYEAAVEAERNVFAAPRTSLFYSRLALERAVRWLYAHDDYLQMPAKDTLRDLLYEQTFRDNLTPSLFKPVDLIRRLGNQAVHSDRKVTKKESQTVFGNLFQFLYWLQRYYSESPLKNVELDLNKIPKADTNVHDKSAKQLAALSEQLKGKDVELEQIRHKYDELRRQLQQIKARNQEQITEEIKPYSEAKTRQLFIDLMLKEAGWDPHGRNVEEYQVDDMPNQKGIGFSDYVLWGDDGLPLAVIEAKRTSKSPQTGKKQAELYATSLERAHKQRPIIFYTNGYETWLWDDEFYPPRRVQGFYTKDQLQLLIRRRKTRKPLNQQKVNKNIAGRHYQEEAIRRVSEAFEARKRHALLVMATGTGKTRTAVALVDLLIKANWAKNVLFLADRKELVKQAHSAFTTYLPNTSVVNLLKEKEDTTSRIVISTYPTMMNLIDQTKKDEKRFGVGQFDLVIIDESHRSIYKKYGAIFDYFDSLLLGLTATPKTDIDKNTYRIFELEDNVPTFAYEYTRAVEDKYLVPAKPIKVNMKFPHRGIKYSELSDEEKAEYEDEFTDEVTGEKPEQIAPSAINSWLFNEDTVDKAIRFFMAKGLKVKGGDEIGKTIIFAKNHKHAEFIVERFNSLFPEHRGKFIEIIDNRVSYADTLLTDFKKKNEYPQIAVSVDMLDTGIDIPEIVNLVFLKPVYSKAKFWQMIGRGTRLCPDLFGLGHDKKEFYLFDFCGNIEFFEAFPEGKEAELQESLNEQLFATRSKLIYHLQKEGHDEPTVREHLTDYVTKQVNELDPNHFLVRPHSRQVERFGHKESWTPLSEEELREAIEHLGQIVKSYEADDVKRFDLLMLKLQLSLIEPVRHQKKMVANVVKIGKRLEEKANIEEVKDALPIIKQVQKPEFWEHVTAGDLEKIKVTLRDLIKYLDQKQRKVVYTDFEDEIESVEDAELPFEPDLKDYREEISSYIRQHKDHVAIQKLRTNKQITEMDLKELENMLFAEKEGTREQFEEVFGKEKPLGVFVREILGLEQGAAKEAFSKLLGKTTLNANQIHFIEQIIDYFSQNGILEPGMLFEEPFTNIHSEGVTGLFPDEDTVEIINIIKRINENARIS